MTDVLDVRALLAKDEHSEEDETMAPVLEIDVGNLLVFDYQDQPKGAKHVKGQAERCVQGLFDKVFNLPVTKSDQGPLAQLPCPTTPIPREKPLPAPKPLTKWETFAKEKGIHKQKKRSRLAFDETSGEYKPRYGSGRAADPVADNWVLPDNPAQLEKFGAEDPFELAQKKKKAARDSQKKRETANKRRREATVADPLTLNLNHVDKRPKEQIQKAISVTQRSTASMGKFDKAHKDEPKMKSAPTHMPSDFNAEQQLTKRIADRILRDMPEIDTTQAANQAIQREQQQRRQQHAKGDRPFKKRKQ